MPHRRAPGPLWTISAAAALVLGVVGAKLSARFLEQRSSSAEPARPVAAAATPLAPSDDELSAFTSSVAQDADAFWAEEFRRRAKPYRGARVVLLDTPSASDCGPGIELGRPECIGNEQAFLDLSFARALDERYGADARGAQAYAIAHEIGHHVQRVLGLDQKIGALLATRKASSHAVEVQLELQADCLAGVWMRRTEQHRLEPAQIEASIRRASELGTERQLAAGSARELTGETFTYAIPRRRIYWLSQGYAQADIDDCDTFAP